MRAEARFFKSLSDETRLKILWLLSGIEEICEPLAKFIRIAGAHKATAG
jgi:DNA-binding transcriptional ArsR family regulator